MDANPSNRPVWWEERTLGVVTLIAVTTALVFYLDLISPLDLTVWILYFIPLYLTSTFGGTRPRSPPRPSSSP